MEKNILPIGMITDDNFIMPTSVAITSIMCNKSETTFCVFHIIMAECSEKSKTKMNEISELFDGCEIKIIEVGLDRYRDFKQLAHIPIACLLKFDLCDLIPDYDKVLYLDGDIIVREDLWRLYSTDLESKYAAAVKELRCLVEDKGNINAGIMLFNAKRIREEHLSNKLYEIRKSLGDRVSMDQQTFNIVTNKEYQYISIRYNCIAGRLEGDNRVKDYTVESINDLYHEHFASLKEVIDSACIVHFATSNKPWIYTFNTEAKEWYSYYLKSPFKDEPFELRGRWKYRYDMMKAAWRQEGFKGVKSRVKDKMKRTFSKNKTNVNWE